MYASNDLWDFKFFCFGGNCQYFKVDFNRFVNHQANYYWPNGELISVTEATFKSEPSLRLPQIDILSNMISIAERLSKDFPFARVDMYNINNQIVFGELTFYPASGYESFTPDLFDEDFGKFFTKWW